MPLEQHKIWVKKVENDRDPGRIRETVSDGHCETYMQRSWENYRET